MKERDVDDGVFDPETIFEEGRIAGEELASSVLREQVSEQLAGIGLDKAEIEALFDPAPRKGKGHMRGKINCSKRQRETMPQICKGERVHDPAPKRTVRKYHPAPDYTGSHHSWQPVSGHYRRTFDPAPMREQVRETARRGSKKAKDLLTKLTKNEMAVGGVAAVGTFLALYQQRTGVLKAAGTKLKDGTTVGNLLQAIQYDFEQFSANGGIGAIPGRLQAAWKAILGFGLGGLATREFIADIVPRKYKKLAIVLGDVAMGIAGGYALKAVADLPDDKTVRQDGNGITVIRQPSPTPTAVQQMNIPVKMGVVNPY